MVADGIALIGHGYPSGVHQRCFRLQSTGGTEQLDSSFPAGASTEEDQQAASQPRISSFILLMLQTPHFPIHSTVNDPSQR